MKKLIMLVVCGLAIGQETEKRVDVKYLLSYQLLVSQVENLKLRVCAEAEIKPDSCRVDWNKGTVSSSEVASVPKSK